LPSAVVPETQGYRIKVRPFFSFSIDVMHFGFRKNIELTVAHAATELRDIVHPLFINRVRAATFHVP
jgi:hypothetical protein